MTEEQNKLDIVKEALEMLHEDDKNKHVMFRQFDETLVYGRIIKMLKTDGLIKNE